MPTPIANSSRVRLTADELDALMPEGERVHTFQQVTGILLGCDMRREEILRYARDPLGCVELAGAVATEMNHGAVLFHPDMRDTFIETKPLP